MVKRVFLFAAAIFVAALGCATPRAIAQEAKTVVLATTTSVQDTGLLDVLLEKFQAKTGYIVKPIAVGSGQALQMGRQGEADILWVHSPDDEKKFVDEGYGIERTTFAHNDFVLLGPAEDPAKVKGTTKAVDAFKKIAASGALFISRGDQSGTHKKELKIWKAAGVEPDKAHYIEAGQGMAATLNMANEKQGYCLVDRSTYLSLKKNLKLVILSEGDGILLNKYSLILANPQKFSKINVAGGRALFDFILSQDAKAIIIDFGRKKFGQQLFFYDYQPKQ
ncbi:MAG: substrate-binding domain-containing protein [Candidatus Omnitrophica bacterium]|nr:substrate-binding domain-containing protein [Candidatus Omnitrophota bacterium]